MEPYVVRATIRVSDDEDWIYIECCMSDGQKFVAVQVAKEFPQLASDLCLALNLKSDA